MNGNDGNEIIAFITLISIIFFSFVIFFPLLQQRIKEMGYPTSEVNYPILGVLLIVLAFAVIIISFLGRR